MFATLRQGVTEELRAVAKAMQQRLVEQLGGVAKPARVYVVNVLPTTRSTKACCDVHCRPWWSTMMRAISRRRMI
ncbi:AMP-binding enzyme [Dyella humicola]|uniref:AMP-binding enzyme n=1 Tax=Dyella humicola TaxID=2992126 RepID=UPI003CE475DE